MTRKRKRTVIPAPRPPLRPGSPILDLDRIAAEVHAQGFWIERTSVPLDGRRRK